jgi:hypothetical protein
VIDPYAPPVEPKTPPDAPQSWTTFFGPIAIMLVGLAFLAFAILNAVADLSDKEVFSTLWTSMNFVTLSIVLLAGDRPAEPRPKLVFVVTRLAFVAVSAAGCVLILSMA